MSAAAIQPYALLDDQECEERIIRAKQKLGDRLVILGHHYQRDEVFRHADFTGDSLKLSRQAANSKAEYIVFCGVHFMAEVADILTRPEQISILPDMAAGCSMADMADLQHVEKAWQELSEVLNQDEQITVKIAGKVLYDGQTAAAGTGGTDQKIRNRHQSLLGCADHRPVKSTGVRGVSGPFRLFQHGDDAAG